MRGRELSLIILILLVAAGTRFWQLDQFELQHDEISALLRTGYATWGQLIEQGVAKDGHPAAIQVFLHYYAPWVDYQPWALKLPFVLLGLASVALLMLIGDSLGQRHAGLLSAALLAVMQYAIFPSQTIRPYAPGLFFSLLAGLFYLRYFRQGQRSAIWLWALSAAAMAYIHHFAALLAALMALSALARARGTERAIVLGAWALALLLYSPHLSIFIKQLSMGGVENWLAKPSWGFPWQLGAYALHFSPLFAAGLAAFWLFGQKSPAPIFREGFFWFGGLLLIGFGYSWLSSAVLQYSVLLFAFPFLLLSFWTLRQPRNSALAVMVIMALGLWSLYQQRQHYPLAYRSPFFSGLSEALAPENSLVIHNLDRDKIAWAAQQMGLDSQAIKALPSEEAWPQWWQNLALAPGRPIALLWSHQEAITFGEWLAQKSGRGLVVEATGFGFRRWRLSLDKPYTPESLPRRPGSLSEAWDLLGSEYAFGGSHRENYRDMPLAHEQDYIVARWRLRCPEPPREIVLASALYRGDSLLQWRSRAARNFFPAAGEEFIAFHAFQVPPAWRHYPDLRWEVYAYSPAGEAAQVSFIDWYQRSGNTRVYGLVEDF